MSIALSSPLHLRPASGCGRLRRAASRLRGRVLAVAAGTTLVVLAWDALEILPGVDSAAEVLASLTSILCAAVVLLPAMLIADEAVDDGVSRWGAYGGAAAAAACVALALQILAVAAIAQWNHAPGLTLRRQVGLFIDTDPHWIVAIVALHAALRNALDATARMGRLQIERARARRELMEEGVRTLQARVDPRLLLEAMRAVGRMHERDVAHALGTLESLIGWLRAAMPRIEETRGTGQAELALASAYLALRRDLARPGAFTFAVETVREPRDARLPPMLLVPMIELALGDGPSRELRGHLVLRMESTGTRTCVTVVAGRDAGGGHPAQASFAPAAGRDGREARVWALQQRALALLGERTLLVDGGAPPSRRLTLEWTHGSPDRDPR